MLWETSLLDPEEGIRMRGYNIPQLQVRDGASPWCSMWYISFNS